MTDPFAALEALAARWQDVGDADGATADDDRTITLWVNAGNQLHAALAEARQAMDALVAERDAAKDKAARFAQLLAGAAKESNAALSKLAQQIGATEAERDAAREALERVESVAADLAGHRSDLHRGTAARIRAAAAIRTYLTTPTKETS